MHAAAKSGALKCIEVIEQVSMFIVIVAYYSTGTIRQSSD